MSQLSNDQDRVLLRIGLGERIVEFNFGNHLKKLYFLLQFPSICGRSREHGLSCVVVGDCNAS